MRKTIAVTIAVVMLSVTAWVAYAAPSWYLVKISQVGTAVHCSGPAKPFFTVTGEGMTNAPMWIIASDTTQENRAMAVALTALAAGLKVAVYMDISTCGGAYDCTTLYVLDVPVD